MIHREAWYREALLNFEAIKRQKDLLQAVGEPNPIHVLEILIQDKKADIGDWWPEDYDEEESALLEAGEFMEQFALSYHTVLEYAQRGEVAPESFLDDFQERLTLYDQKHYREIVTSYIQEYHGVDSTALPYRSQAQEFLGIYGYLHSLAENAGNAYQAEHLRQWLENMWELARQVLDHATTFRKQEWDREWKEWKSFWEPFTETLSENLRFYERDMV